MKRSAPLPRGKALTRTIGLNPHNRRRRKAQRARNFGDETAAILAMPCIVGVALGTFEQCVGGIEPAHNPSRGAGGGRFDQCPMCKGHHGEQHRIGVESFQLKYGLDLRLEADRIALEHAEPLGLRPVAQRWADRSEGCVLPAMLDTYERDALLGWVRRDIERSVAAFMQGWDRAITAGVRPDADGRVLARDQALRWMAASLALDESSARTLRAAAEVGHG